VLGFTAATGLGCEGLNSRPNRSARALRACSSGDRVVSVSPDAAAAAVSAEVSTVAIGAASC
jgi:hypothetical protein